MLACWMTDQDERPTAEELNLMLADLARGGGMFPKLIQFSENAKHLQSLSGMELDFSLGTGDFQYFPYIPQQEIGAVPQMPRSTLL